MIDIMIIITISYFITMPSIVCIIKKLRKKQISKFFMIEEPIRWIMYSMIFFLLFIGSTYFSLLTFTKVYCILSCVVCIFNQFYKVKEGK